MWRTLTSILFIAACLLAAGPATPWTHGVPIGIGGGGSGGGIPFTLPTGDVLHFVSPTGSDSNDGLTPATAWLTPNHAMNCGDMILASGDYSASANAGNFDGTWGTVSNCPSTSGGIDGTGGIYFAILLCAASDLTGCNMNFTGGNNNSGFSWAIDVPVSNWSVQGFQIHGNTGTGCMIGDGFFNKIHHIAFVNNVLFNCQLGVNARDNGTDHTSGLAANNGFDYTAFIANIAQNSEQNTICTAGIVMVGPAAVDTNSGTHLIQYGNFAFNTPNNGCGTDIENHMLDTPDAHGYTPTIAILNDISFNAWRYGIQFFVQNINGVTGLTAFIHNNTSYNDNLSPVGANGGINVQMDNATAPTIEILRNIAVATGTQQCGLLVGGAHGPSSLANITPGTTGNENVLKAVTSGQEYCVFNGGPTGTNIIADPGFNNTTDLLANRTGAPNCATFQTTTACMGWNAGTKVLTNPSVIYDLQPTCAQCAGKGYQLPSTTCVNSGDIFNLYPTWLKGVGGGLHASGFVVGATITERNDLVTKPCNL